MDKNNTELPKLLPAPWDESLLQRIKSFVVISSVPVVSPVLGEFLDAKLRERVQQRADQFYSELITYIQKIPEQVLMSENFFAATEIVMRKIADEHSEIKRRRFLYLYKQLLEHKNAEVIKIEEFDMWIKIVKDISESAICVLILMNRVNLTENFVKEEKFNESWREFKNLANSVCNIRYLYRFIAELESAGIVAQSSGRWGGNVPYVTEAGLDFLDWISKEE